MTFFDMTYKQFFGLTWKGPTRTAVESVHYDESVYFCSSIRDEHILCVIEIVEEPREQHIEHDGEQKPTSPVGCGWTAFRPFLSSETNEVNKR